MGPEPFTGDPPAEAVADALLLPLSEVEVAEFDAVVVIVEGNVIDGVLVGSDPPLDEPLPVSSDTVHCLTSCTSCCPFTFIGVSVIWHVSVTGPLALHMNINNLSQSENMKVGVRTY